MKIVFLAHTALGGTFVVGSHHLSRSLARDGHRVTHISPPVTLAHLVPALTDRFTRERFRRWLAGGRRLDEVTDVVPFSPLPWQLARYSKWTMSAFSRFMWVRLLRGPASLSLNGADCLIVDEPRFVGIVERQSNPVLIYRATDLYAQMRADASIEAAERAVCAQADLLIATSEPVAAHLRRISGRPVTVITNGVEYDHFATTAVMPHRFGSLPGSRATRAIYVGAFDSRFGVESVAASAAALADRHFILAGPGSEAIAAAIARANVVGLGPIDYRNLPDLLQQCSVGLLPLADHAANAGRSPMKLYEYAAAGLAVAASATEELRRRNLATLCLADSVDEFPRAVQTAFERGGDRASLELARAQAREASWSGKGEELLRLIREARRARAATGDAAVQEAISPREADHPHAGGAVTRERTAWK